MKSFTLHISGVIDKKVFFPIQKERGIKHCIALSPQLFENFIWTHRHLAAENSLKNM